MTNGEYILPTFALEKFEAKSYKGIKNVTFELPRESKWIFLTGENGSGKTTLLQAIALAFNAEYYNNAKILRNIEFKPGKQKGEVSIIHKNISSCEIHGFNFEKEKSFTKVCCYGSSRLDVEDFETRAVESQIEQLFETRTLLRNIGKEISRWYVKKDSNNYQKKKFAIKYETVTSLFIELLDLQKIEVDFDTDVVYYYEKDESGEAYNKVTFNQLASGHRSIISMVGDMILRLFDTQPDVYNSAELSGIIIIDELDLHLHPKLQRKLPSLLSKAFPNVQFIASTHSPIPLLGALQHSVFLKVNRDVENGITVERLEDMEQQISSILPNTILSSPIFGMRDIFPVTYNSENGIRTEDTYAEIEFNDQVKKELKSYLGTERAKELEQLFKSK